MFSTASGGAQFKFAAKTLVLDLLTSRKPPFVLQAAPEMEVKAVTRIFRDAPRGV